MKKQRGITLIALIITIVVLLILAGVTIGAVKESGIIGHAQKATSEYTIAQEKEKIALAYSEYKIKKAFDNTNVEEFKIDEEDVITEPIGNYGWKVKYEDTGNVYGINLKGEYDEAVSMIIEASEATGVSVNKFIIFEDKYAINANKSAGNITMPERYVFYNWAEVTEDERKTLELYDPITPSTALVENASNRILIMDANGDGGVSYADAGQTGYEDSDFYEIWQMVAAYRSPKKMTDDIHEFYANICYYKDTGENVYDDLVSTLAFTKLSEDFYCFLWDWNFDYGHLSTQGPLVSVAFGRNDTFRKDIYEQHVYYTSPRYEADFE